MFKVGDRVRCIKDYGDIKKDHTYIFMGNAHGGVFNFLNSQEGLVTEEFNPDNFENIFELEPTTTTNHRTIDSLSNSECILCTTKQQAEYICKLFHEDGQAWADGCSYVGANHRGSWNKRSISKSYFGDNTWNNGSKRYNTGKGYTVIPAEEFGAPPSSREETIECGEDEVSYEDGNPFAKRKGFQPSTKRTLQALCQEVVDIKIKLNENEEQNPEHKQYETGAKRFNLLEHI